MKITFTLILASIIVTIPGLAQDKIATGVSSKSNKRSLSQIYLETDPTTYFFGGYSLAVRRSSTFIDKLNCGIGIYSAVLPKEFIEQNDNHKGKGWKAKNLGVDAFFDYHLFDPNKGLTAGMVLSIYSYKIERDNIEGRITSFVPTARIGYLWRPLPKKISGLYLYPWVGFSTDQQFTGDNEINGEKFEIPKWSFVPSLQIGFSF